jgi:glycosyltransferase involved in cell wall biosynthesis
MQRPALNTCIENEINSLRLDDMKPDAAKRKEDPLWMPGTHVAVLTAGRDRPYALGLAGALIREEISFDFVGSNSVDSPVLHDNPCVNFRNLRDETKNSRLGGKAFLVLVYYLRLMTFAVTSRSEIFHILWNNKFELFDRTFLMLFYRLCGRKLVFTAHNVNAGNRDGNDSVINRLTLWIQYRLSHHVFVHTEQMRKQLQADFHIQAGRCSVIPFGINSTVPNTSLDGPAARVLLGLNVSDRVMLFFGNIAPYKGLEYLVEAMALLPQDGTPYKLVIAGRLKCLPGYWQGIEESISRLKLGSSIFSRVEYIPDEETEIYFKAADVVVLPYRHIFQSGVLFLGYNFGLPVIASNVGSLKEDVVENTTGFLCQPEDAVNLAKVIQVYFDSDLYRNLRVHREEIRVFASSHYSWSRVMTITKKVYSDLLT